MALLDLEKIFLKLHSFGPFIKNSLLVYININNNGVRSHKNMHF